jgi:dihydroorotate dehydrogenase
MPGLYENILRPAMFSLDAERAHELGLESLRLGLSFDLAQRIAAGRFSAPSFDDLERFGLRFANPLGVAAGFDKNGVVVNQLASLGFGFVEVGTVTFKPQKGNEKPRLFRLPEDKALINRLGFNNDGAAAVAERLRKLDRRCVVGVNIGRNKDVPNEEAVENYLASFDLVHGVADYIAINISSPNTPNLRELQRGESFEELIRELTVRNRDLSSDVLSPDVLSPGFSRPNSQERPPKGGTQNGTQNGTQDPKPLLVKIAPDLSESEIEQIVDICLKHGIGGIIATNTTTGRENVKSREVAKLGAGGLSGLPLRERSTDVIASVFRYSKGKLPIIGVGGIFTAEGAFEKIAAGASLLQAYTGFVYTGPSFARNVNRGLLHMLKVRGFKNLDEAVGSESTSV